MALMKDKEDVNSSDFKSAAWKKGSPAWKITSDWWESPLSIRSQGEVYLEQFAKEPDEKYQNRLKSSVPINEFRATIETMAGMVFRTDPKPDEVHDEIAELLTDIDQCGNSFWAWNMKSFQKYLRDGLGFIYVDAPPLKKETQEKVTAGQTPTLMDRAGDRPYLVYYCASQIINVRHETINGVPRLSQVTIEELIMVPSGEFGEEQVVQHRILRPGSWETRRENPETNKFIPFETGTSPLPEITLVPVGDLDGIPPLLALLMLNVSHYNKTSDYDSICHLVCTPQQVRRYDSKEDSEAAAAMQIASPGIGIKGWGEHFDAKYLEVTGAGLERAEKRYKDIEQKMAEIGVGMLSPNDAASIKTATEVMDTAGQRQSKLASYTREWENGVEKALYFVAELINAIKGSKTIDLDSVEEKTKMSLKIDYERLTFNLAQLTFFSDQVDSGKLSLQTYLEWLPQVIDMPPNFSPSDELQRIRDVNKLITEPDTSLTNNNPPAAQ